MTGSFITTRYGKLEQIGQATLFKRVDDSNEGAACDAKRKGFVGLVRRFGWVIWLFPPMLFTDYFVTLRCRKGDFVVTFPSKNCLWHIILYSNGYLLDGCGNGS